MHAGAPAATRISGRCSFLRAGRSFYCSNTVQTYCCNTSLRSLFKRLNTTSNYCSNTLELCVRTWAPPGFHKWVGWTRLQGPNLRRVAGVAVHRATVHPDRCTGRGCM